MDAKYEYKFVRVGQGPLWARKEAEERYRGLVHAHAREGWRLIQVFAPSTGPGGATRYYELIFERGLGR